MMNAFYQNSVIGYNNYLQQTMQAVSLQKYTTTKKMWYTYFIWNRDEKNEIKGITPYPDSKIYWK